MLDRPADSVGGTLGGCHGDDVRASFSDTAPVVSCATTIPAVSGTVKAAAPLAVYGTSWVSGTWQIEVRDMATGGDGFVNDASLVVTCGYTDGIFTDGFDLY